MAGASTRQQRMAVGLALGLPFVAGLLLIAFVDETNVVVAICLVLGAGLVGVLTLIRPGRVDPEHYDDFLAWWKAALGLIFVWDGIVWARDAEDTALRVAWIALVPAGLLWAFAFARHARRAQLAHKEWLAAGRPRPEEPASS